MGLRPGLSSTVPPGLQQICGSHADSKAPEETTPSKQFSALRENSQRRARLKPCSSFGCSARRLRFRKSLLPRQIASRHLLCDSQDMQRLGVVRINRKNVSQTPDGLVCSSQLAQKKSSVALENHVGHVYLRCLVKMIQCAGEIAFLLE